MWESDQHFITIKKKENNEDEDDHNGDFRTARSFSVNAGRYGFKDSIHRCDTSKQLLFLLINITIM